MATDRELMQMALDALNNFDKGNHGMRWQVPIIKALRAALAQPEHGDGYRWREGDVPPSMTYTAPPQQPEPEPFEYWNAVEGWVKIEEVRQHFDTAGCGTIYKTSGEGRVPLYTAPQREWQGLTDEEILADDVLRYHFALNGGAGPISKKGKAIIDALNNKLKDKNYD